MSYVVTFGELMLRLTTPDYQRLAQAQQFDIAFGGAEANVAVAIAQLGGRAEFVSRLPENALAERALDELRRVKVGVKHVVRGGERVGLYFVEQGASHRPATVVYDRTGSALATARHAEFDWSKIFAEASWFHWSGITPALSENAAQAVGEACALAHARGLPVSFDLNYRSKLWSRDRAREVLAPLMEQVDLCICSAADARDVFRMRGESAPEVAAALRATFGFKTIAFTMRESSSANRTLWSAALFTAEHSYSSRRYEIDIIDRIGAGDAFAGSLVASMLRGDSLDAALEFAVAAGALKHTISGDYPLFTRVEVEALLAGADGGRVQR